MWLRGIAASLLIACAVLLATAGNRAAAQVLVVIDKDSQQMSVAVNGRTRYVWPVSTGRAGYGTPSGRFQPQWMARTYFSKKYYDAPMPYSIFFYHGYAIHGTEDINRLGGPASHGCVRLHPRNAATLFALVQRYGMESTEIIVGNSVALRRPERWGANEQEEERFLTLMTDRLMLAQQIERKDALAKLEQVRASDALRRILVRRGGGAAAESEEEPEVAIGIAAEDRAAVPRQVWRSAAQEGARRSRRPAARPDAAEALVPMPPRRAASISSLKQRIVRTRTSRRAAPVPPVRPAHAGERRKFSATSQPARRSQVSRNSNRALLARHEGVRTRL
jgi:hypothetical protein